MGNWVTTYGFSTQYVNYSNSTSNLINNFNYTTDLNFVRYGLFAQATGKFYKDRLSLSFGLRADGNTFTETGNEIFRTISPRGAISWKLTEDGIWNLNASAGRYFKIPPYTILGFRDNQGLAVNKNLAYIRSDHLIAGVEFLVSESARITVEGFAKWYDDYPVSITDSVSLANKGGGFEVLGNEPVVSAGKGRTYGAEFLFQQKFNNNFYAIVSYTFYKSEFTGFDRTKYLPSVWDNRHLISLTGGYKFLKSWELSARYRFLGKTPFPPIDEVATLANYPAIIRDYARLGEEQLSPFSQLDVRLDKKFNFKKFSLDLFADVQNVLFTPLPTEPRYGLARNEQGVVIQPAQLSLVNTQQDGQFIPSLGIVLNF